MFVYACVRCYSKDSNTRGNLSGKNVSTSTAHTDSLRRSNTNEKAEGVSMSLIGKNDQTDQ